MQSAGAGDQIERRFETTRAKEQTNRVALVVDGKKHCIDRTAAAAVQINEGRVKASMHVKINGYFYFIILNLNCGVNFNT